MAGPFLLHKNVLSESATLHTAWKDRLKTTQGSGPEIAILVSGAESLISLFNRERELLMKLLFSKNNQMRNFKFWQLTKQIHGHLKTMNIELLTSTLQSVHLQFSQGKKTRPSDDLSYVLAFVLHYLSSNHWIWMDTLSIIKLAYNLYCNTIEMSHWMPISLGMMAVLSRLHLLCTRLAVITGTVYNLLYKHFQCNENISTKLNNQWTTWIGSLKSELEIPEEVVWQDIPKMEDSKNQQEIDALNRALERTKESDDLGEAMDMDEDDSNEIASNLIYRPPSTPSKPIKALTSPEKNDAKATSSDSKPKGVRHVYPLPSPPLSPVLSHSTVKIKEKSKDKLREKHKDKSSEKMKEKKSSSSTASMPSKDSKKDKARSKEKSKDREESKKRKVQASSLDDEIDDLFGLLTPTNKKPKHK